MKKIIGYVLFPLFCFFYVQLALATSGPTNSFSVGKSLSVSGNYISGLNRVDGTFESSATQWNASVGTITQTASTEYQGNFKGVWAGTGTGTLDLQWTATASNTYEATAQVNVKAEDDVYVCVYVGTTETGCKLIPALDKIQKVSAIADSTISSAFYLRLKHTGSDAFSVDVDDGKIEPWTPAAVNLVTQESITYTGYTSGTNPVTFKTKDASRSNDSTLISGTASRFTVLKPCNVTIVAALDIFGSGSYYGTINQYDSLGNVVKGSVIYGTSAQSDMAIPITTRANAGDYFIVQTNGTPTDTISTFFSITASAISKNTMLSWQDGTEWTKYTPSVQGFTSITSDDVRYKRVGSDLFIQGFFSNTSSGATEARVYLPSGLVINTGTSSNKIVGQSARETASANGAMNVLAKNGATYLTFGIQSASYAGLTNRLASELLGAESFSFWAKIPIQGWSSTPTLVALPTSKDNNKIYDKTLVAVTSDVAGWVNDFVEIYPYRTISKVTGLPVWRMTFNIRGTVTAGTRLFTNLTIPGVSIKTNQSFSGITSIVSPMYNSTTSTGLYMEHNSGSTIWYTASGDIELNSKPTWADEWIEPGVFVGNVQPDWQYDLTVTGDNSWSTIRAVATISKMGGGQYKMNFIIVGSSSSVSSINLTISGVVFKNVSSYNQGLSGESAGQTLFGRVNPNAATMTVVAPSTTSVWRMFGDVELESKPSWATQTP